MRIFALIGLWLALASPAHAWIHGNAPVIFCPYTIDNGCAYAAANFPYAAFQNPTFFEASSTPSVFGPMRQSGQTYAVTPFTAATTQNVAGVSYPISIPATWVGVGSITGSTLTVVSTIYGSLSFPVAAHYTYAMDEAHGGVLIGTHITADLGGGQYTVQVLGASTAQTTGLQIFMVYALKSPNYVATEHPDCVWTATATGITVPFGQTVTCSGTSDATLTLDKYDFGPGNICDAAGTAGCTTGVSTFLQVKGTRTSFSITNSKFVMDAAENQNGPNFGSNTSTLIFFNNGPYKTIETNNLLDTCGVVDFYCPQGFNSYTNPWTTTRTTYNSSAMTDTRAGGSNDTEYNAIVGVDNRDFPHSHATCNTVPVLGVPTGGCDTYVTKYNYAPTTVYGNNNQIHGEYDLIGIPNGCNVSTAIGCTENTLYDVEGNVFGTPGNGLNTGAGVTVTATTHATTTVDGITAGSLSSLTCTNANVYSAGGGIPANTSIVSFNNGSLKAATSVVLNNAVTLPSGTVAQIGFYGGNSPAGCAGFAVTSPLAPWGSSFNSSLQMDQEIISNNVFVTNVSPLPGGPNSACVPAVAGPPCFATAGTGAIYWTHDYHLNVTVSGNFIDPTGSFNPYNLAIPGTPSALAMITSGSATLTSTSSTIPVGWYPVDVTAGTFLGAAAPIVGAAATSIGSCSLGASCFTYPLVVVGTAAAYNAPSTVASETIYWRNVVPVMSGNIDMINGASCDALFSAINILNKCGGEYP